MGEFWERNGAWKHKLIEIMANSEIYIQDTKCMQGDILKNNAEQNEISRRFSVELDCDVDYFQCD